MKFKMVFTLCIVLFAAMLLPYGSYGGQLKQLHYDKFRSLTGHTNDVQCIAFSHDGKLMAAGSSDKTVTVSFSSDGRIMASFAPKMNIEVGPFGIPVHVSSASDTCDIILWDTQTWKVLNVMSGFSCDINQLSFDGTGKSLITAGKVVTVYRSE